MADYQPVTFRPYLTAYLTPFEILPPVYKLNVLYWSWPPPRDHFTSSIDYLTAALLFHIIHLFYVGIVDVIASLN